jgi:hypothetical protein
MHTKLSTTALGEAHILNDNGTNHIGSNSKYFLAIKKTTTLLAPMFPVFTVAKRPISISIVSFLLLERA